MKKGVRRPTLNRTPQQRVVVAAAPVQLLRDWEDHRASFAPSTEGDRSCHCRGYSLPCPSTLNLDWTE
eukprot:scaffold438_cov250-Pinguiococcus_pyrenoidosus.AAC.28